MRSKVKRMLGVAILIGMLAIAAGAFYFTNITNPRVINEIRTDPTGNIAQRSMILSLPSSKQIPVNYLRENDRVYVGADFGWWKQFRGEGADVELLVQGVALEGHGVAVENDAAYTQEIFARLRPTAPKWLPSWLNGTLIVITLVDSAGRSDGNLSVDR